MTNKIPKQLKTCMFNRVKFKEKRAFERGWQNKPYSYKEIQKYFPEENYGVMCGKELRVLDDDTPDKILINLFIENFGKTFRVRDHLYFKFDNGDGKKVIFYDQDKQHLGELQGEGTYVVGAGSTHPSGEIYELKEDIEIKTISYDKFEEVFREYLFSKNSEIWETEPKKLNYESEDDINSIPLTDVISTVGLKKRGLEYQGSNPWHGSATGMNFAINTSKNVWYCFRCGVGGGVVQAIGLNNGIISSCGDKISKKQFKKILKIAHEKYGLKIRSKAKKENEENFNFESKKLKIQNIDELEKIIKKNFPSIWFETKACLSVNATMSLKNLNGCPSLNLVGNPSGEKTTVLSFFYGQKNTYISDDFTPRAFVSHSSNVPKEELEQIDLLPRLKNKTLLTPELAPLFESPKDKLVDNFAMLTRVLDGEGLNRDSGTHGHRGYSGDYKFAWLGATTPIRASVWNIMGKIGNRLFFLNMRDKNRSNDDYLEMFSGKAYEEKVKECRGAVISFLDFYFSRNPLRTVEWDAEGDILLLPEIIKYAKFLSKLRGSLMLWKSEERGKYEFSFPIIEEPPRAINSLYNLAKGHALIHGRKFLKKEDLEIVKEVCFSSMPHDRVEFLKLLAKHDGKLTTKQIEKELGCSQDTALRTMNIFKILGVVEIKSINLDYGDVGRPMKYIEINKEFEELLAHTQVINGAIKYKSQQNRGAGESYDNLNPADFLENNQKKPRAHPENSAINIKPQQNNPALGQKQGLTQGRFDAIGNFSKLKILDFFKENQDRIVALEEIESFFPNPKQELSKLKERGLIFELQKNKYQYLG